MEISIPRYHQRTYLNMNLFFQRSRLVSQRGLKFVAIFMPKPHNCWDYRAMLLRQVDDFSLRQGRRLQNILRVFDKMLVVGLLLVHRCQGGHLRPPVSNPGSSTGQ